MENILVAKILGTYPFSELQSRGWQLEQLSRPFARRPGRNPVRTARFSTTYAAFTFDVDEVGRMSEFATYARDDDITLTAETPEAVVLLAASSPYASLEELCAIADVEDVHRRYNL
ncbi:hypothetical protein [Rhodococcus jostii]|uniref:hypothetical protein n=1 Tax=Rhodococcus jostii TaxID=132919 RepID=UPI003634355C